MKNIDDFSPSKIEKKEEPYRHIRERAQELGPELYENYKDIHEHPELGGEEVETAKKVVKFLEDLGIEIIGKEIGNSDKLKGQGVVARIEGKEGGPTIALRADMDALPIKESETNEPRSKKENVMHGCGHDVHTSSLMGAAKILKEMADRGELDGDVLLLFQSSEEKSHQKESGALQIVKFLEEQGLRDKIKAFFGLHVAAELERGKILLKEGTQLASSGEITVALKGPGGHVLNLYETPDLHEIFSKITVRIKEEFRSLYEEQQALVGSTRTDYKGSGYNIMPAEGESTLVVRVLSPEYKKMSDRIAADIEKIVDEVVNGAKDHEKIDVEVKRIAGYRPVIHRDPELVKIAADSSEQVIDNLEILEKHKFAGEDFSYYLEKFRGKQIPGVFLNVGAVNPENGYPRADHHKPDFKIDPDTMQDLAALYANLSVNSINYFKNKE